ncbi:MAG: nucleotidyltransferase domain-containing protein, partial [Candidatus Kapabacteria bacterium]|jgi:hypothetical protein|nr:nucleotidyltransferase domain-containing protein [Candidatus Kapabacteria bacterium]
MTILPEILSRLEAAKPTLRQKYPLAAIEVFGSYSRGEVRPDSDVDILVEFSPPVGFEIADLAMELYQFTLRIVHYFFNAFLWKQHKYSHRQECLCH